MEITDDKLSENVIIKVKIIFKKYFFNSYI